MTYPPNHILLNKYRIDSLIGQGAFAKVYLATHLALNAPRALKILRKETPGIGSTEFDSFRTRFQLEAQLGAKLEGNPHVIQVYDFEQDGETLILVMEYAEGGSLAERLAHARENGDLLPLDDTLKMASEVARGLAALHALDAVHRDLKPSNILFDKKGRAKVADVGLAQVPGGPSMRSQLSTGVPHPGTPAYMSPEQKNINKYLSPASDIYSLGLVLFEALTGRVYRSQRPGTQASELRQDVPNWVNALLDRMLAKTLQERPWDGQEVKNLLQEGVNRKNRKRRKEGTRETAKKEEKRSKSDQKKSPGRPWWQHWGAWIVGASVLALFLIVILGSRSPKNEVVTETYKVEETFNQETVKPPTTDPPPPTETETPTRTSTPTNTSLPTTPAQDMVPLPGDETVQLTFDSKPYYMAALSPDQTKMVAFAEINDYWQIVEIDPVKGGMIRQITTNNANHYHPHFSADGEEILIASDQDGYFNIYLISFNTGEVTKRLTNMSASNMTPDWIPGEQSFVFMSKYDGDFEVFLGYVDGRYPKQLTHNTVYDGTTAVSPDGEQIVFYSDRSGNGDIYLMDLNSENVVQLTSSNSRDAEPVFSPDGEWVAFESNRTGNYSIWAIRKDGTGLKQVTSGNGNEQIPGFSPDGNWLLYQSDINGNYDIFRKPWP